MNSRGKAVMSQEKVLRYGPTEEGGMCEEEPYGPKSEESTDSGGTSEAAMLLGGDGG